MSEARKRATYQDVLDAPEHQVAEIIGGQLRLSPRPGGPATEVASALFGELRPPFGRGRGGPGGWVIVFEPELHIADDILVPDLAGWRRERLPTVPDGAFFTVTPDWVCEVLSRSTERIDRAEKMDRYRAMGVKHLWLVHPRMKTAEVYRLVDECWLRIAVHKDSECVRIEPFEAVELGLASLWQDLPFPTGASEPSSEWEYERSVLTP